LGQRGFGGCRGHRRSGCGILIGHVCRFGERRGSIRSLVCIDHTRGYIHNLDFLFGGCHEIERSRLRVAGVGVGIVSCLQID
jgi:hypothetical protein